MDTFSVCFCGVAPSRASARAQIACARRLRVRSCAEGDRLAVGKTARPAEDLSDRALALIKEQRQRPIFDYGRFGSVYETAQNENRFLSDGELKESSAGQQELVEAAKLMREKTDSIVGRARASMYIRFPSITMPGGALFPAFRADACWRDFQQFTRVASYSVAMGSREYLNSEGLEVMRQIYAELAVPLDAMQYGLEQLCVATQKLMSTDGQREAVNNAFGELRESLRRFEDQ